MKKLIFLQKYFRVNKRKLQISVKYKFQKKIYIQKNMREKICMKNKLKITPVKTSLWSIITKKHDIHLKS